MSEQRKNASTRIHDSLQSQIASRDSKDKLFSESAVCAMHALILRGNSGESHEAIADQAVEYAKALMSRLDQIER